MISRAYIPFILNSEIVQVERARPGTPMIRKPYSTSTEGNTGLKEQRRRRLRKRPLKVNSRITSNFILLIPSHSTPFEWLKRKINNCGRETLLL